MLVWCDNTDQSPHTARAANMSQTHLYTHSVQEEALDLSLKKMETKLRKEEKTLQGKPSPSSPLVTFPQARRSPVGQKSIGRSARNEKTMKLNNNFPVGVRGREVGRELSSTASRKTKAKTQKKIAIISEMCDCRLCYEAHIYKMRLKLCQMI